MLNICLSAIAILILLAKQSMWSCILSHFGIMDIKWSVKNSSLVTHICHVVYMQLSCLILYDPMDCSPSGSFICEIFQARILKWVVISSSRHFPDPKIKPAFLAMLVDSLPLSHLGNLKSIIGISQIFLHNLWMFYN